MLKFNRKEKGQGLVEYALILVLIAIVTIVAMTTLGGETSSVFRTVQVALENASSTTGGLPACTSTPPICSSSNSGTTVYGGGTCGWGPTQQTCDACQSTCP